MSIKKGSSNGNIVRNCNSNAQNIFITEEIKPVIKEKNECFATTVLKLNGSISELCGTQLMSYIIILCLHANAVKK